MSSTNLEIFPEASAKRGMTDSKTIDQAIE